MVVLTIDPNMLIGRLVKELNPGGSKEYYHLCNGSVPRSAVIDVERRNFGTV
ncbi:hypothetical protein SCG7086_AY_00100 [Chlamydiales bacterium SCGC AG-110-P3]|nr:hypothetical protein SCG7086_AY_00100 [Chlamydiales bacterium SCGC AG-110-P3]